MGVSFSRPITDRERWRVRREPPLSLGEICESSRVSSAGEGGGSEMGDSEEETRMSGVEMTRSEVEEVKVSIIECGSVLERLVRIRMEFELDLEFELIGFLK